MKNHFILPETAFYNLDHYQEVKGNALKAARALSAQEILVELKAAHLRGRGGAGFPAGLKWFTLFQQSSSKKYVVVNAAEGEPGTFKDRFILRKNPYAVIEGALIAAHVLKTNDIYIAFKRSFTEQLERLQGAIAEFKQRHLLEKVKIHLVAGPEDYLFGEEKALLNVIEGIGPFPREAHYPPYEIGLFATPSSSNPALVNNVETFARVPEIILRGAESFRSIGSEDTPGPLICTVSGDVKRPGVYEVPAGITLREVLERYASGPANKNNFKFVMPGVSSPIITKEQLDVKLTYEDMLAIGSGLDSCSFMVFDESRSAARVAQEVANFLFKESCNQCTNCKSGLGISAISLDGLFRDNPDHTLIDRALLGAKSAPQSNRCYLPVQGSIVIPSLVDNFRQEFIDLLEGKVGIPAPVTLPLIKDYDEMNHEFVLKDLHAQELIGPDPDEWPKDQFFMDRGTF